LRLPSFKLNIASRIIGGGSGHLRCPYKGCEQEFDKPSLLTDTSVIPSESYYACPHCMSKIELITDKLKIIDGKAVCYGAQVFESPAKCAHYSGGLLGTHNINFNPSAEPTKVPTAGPGTGMSCSCGALTDESLGCPKNLQCEQRRHKY